MAITERLFLCRILTPPSILSGAHVGARRGPSTPLRGRGHPESGGLIRLGDGWVEERGRMRV